MARTQPVAEDVSVEVVAPATPAEAYALVSDITTMGRWSPETTGCHWRRGSNGPSVGARFVGANRLQWKRWWTSNTVVEADAGARFAFRTVLGPLPMASWTYEFEPTTDGAGCKITERWHEMRPRWLRKIDRPVMGVPDRAEHNRANMEVTLERIAAALADR